MPSIPAASEHSDCIDTACALRPGEPVHALRRRRDKVVAGSQGALDALLDPALPGLSPGERLHVAAYACRLSEAAELGAQYRARLLALPDGDAHFDADGEITTADAGGGPRLDALLRFTRTLILRPLEGDRGALDDLRAAGLATAEIVSLSQLIGFLSYQIRLVAGLRALAAAPERTA